MTTTSSTILRPSAGSTPTTDPGSPPRARQPWRPEPSLLALGAGWVALFSWSALVAQPGSFLVPALLIGLTMALAGGGLRTLGLSSVGVALMQLLIALGSFNMLLAAPQSVLGVVPTQDSVRVVTSVVLDGAAALNTYSAPVAVNPTGTSALLLACALAVLLSVDVLAVGLRRPTLAGLPLLITLSVPVSILNDPLALPVLVGTALLFLRLLAGEHLETCRGWGVGPRRQDGSGRQRPVLTMLWQISVAALVLSLLVAPLVPVSDMIGDRTGPGTGTGNSQRLETVNPFIRLRRDLVEQTNTPLVYARTQSRTTSYLRTTVLDRFTDDEWRPSPRNLPAANEADGEFPPAPGLSPSVGGTAAEWELQLTPRFSAPWLPLPYPVRRLEIAGSWRYDVRTLDVVYAGGGSPPQPRYNLTAFTPSIDAASLKNAVPAPDSLLQPMTRLPDKLPQVVGDLAKEVTQDAESEFAKAVALQDWFRDGGGFRYSLEERSGSGLDLLASFVTDDRVGYCEQFAAAMATMGRTLNIPSRVVVGFLAPTRQPDGRLLYTSDDRHAWPEMYFTGAGWVRFEPTPGQRAGDTPTWTRQEAAAAEPSAAPEAASSESAAPSPDGTPTDLGTESDQRSLVSWWPLASLLVVLGLGLGPLVRLIQRRRRLAAGSPVHLAEGAWSELRATALDLGLDWPEDRSPREQARRMLDQVSGTAEDRDRLEGLLRGVERGRYARAGSLPAAAEARAGTVEAVAAWRKVMVDAVDHRSWLGRLWPASVLRRDQ